MKEFEEFYALIEQGVAEAQRAGQAGSYAKLGGLLTEFESRVQQRMRDITKLDVDAILVKLRTDLPLTPQELQVIKLWLVGDAEYYTKKVADEVAGWMTELGRVTTQINALRQQQPAAETASHLQALLRDAIRISWNIHYYLEQQERIGAFEQGTRQLGREERNILIDILSRRIPPPKSTGSSR